ncbi:MAG: S24/S26 family peptidase [Acidobacteriota bacterium]
MREESPVQYALPILRSYRDAQRMVSVPVAGRSMWPLIRPGDHVDIRLVHPEEPSRGDILAFWNDGSLVVHRLVRKSRTSGALRVCQRGDNQHGWSWVDADRVVGTVDAIHRGDRILRMRAIPWRWLNPMLALMSLVWAGALASASRCRRALSS